MFKKFVALIAINLALNIGCVKTQAQPAKPQPFESSPAFAALAPILGYDPAAPIVPFEMPRNKQFPDLRSIRVGKNHVLHINGKTQTLQGCGILERHGLPVVRDEPMTQDEAIAFARTFLNAAGATLDFEEADMQHTYFTDKQASWTIMFFDHIDGFKVWNGSLIRIGAFSNQITFFKLVPPMKPGTYKVEVTADEAVKAVLAKAQDASYQLRQEPPELILSHRMPLDLEDNEDERLYWVVRMVRKQPDSSPSPYHMPPPIFYVDALTGEVISISTG